MSDNVIKVRIQACTERRDICSALANNGYKVWVERKEVFPADTVDHRRQGR